MKLWRRFRRFLQGRSFEADLAEELRIHREMAEASAVRAGATREEARRCVGRDFGSVALTLEDSRAVWKFAWLSSLMQDIRFGLRGFRKSPGFALTVILTLALGLGALGASFSVFNALVLRPFAVRDPYSLYALLGWGEKKGDYQTRPLGWRAFNDLRQRNGAFSEALGFSSVNTQIDGKFAAAQAVTGNYFTMLGARVCMGRPILESDDVPGNGVAVASYAAWKSRFGGAADAVGRKLRVGNHLVELVGVACPEFNGLEQQRMDFWVSLPLSGVLDAPVGGYERSALTVVGRLKPGMTPEGAEAALAAYGQQVYPTWHYGAFPHSATLKQCATVYPLNRDSIATFLPVFAAFGLVLLIACANVSNMMLARALARQREIGIRISLGAGRARVLRQLLTEGLLLAVPAALGAFWAAHAAIRAALWFQDSVLHTSWRWQFPLWNAAPDWHVLGFLAGAAGVSTLAFSLLPALQTLRTRLTDANRGEFSDWRPARLRGILVVAQVAVCALLLISAGVMVRGESRLATQNIGLDLRGTFQVFPHFVNPGGSYTSSPQAARLASDRLRSLPLTAAVSACLFCAGAVSRPDNFFLEAKAETGAATPVAFNLVSPGYLEMFGVPLRGRNFTPGETEADAPVLVISETAARRVFPGSDPLGRTIEVEAEKDVASLLHGEQRRSFQVIGVVPDSSFLYNSEDRAGRARGSLLLPLIQSANGGVHSIIVRVKGDPAAARRAVESAMRQAGLDSSDMSISPLQRALDTYLYPYRALVAISGFLGVLALLLTVSGVFGVSSFTVAQRRKEFGIRIALGAGDTQITGLVLGQSLRFAVAGAALGALAALALARAIAQSFPRIDLFDAVGYAAGALVVMAAAIGAAWIPARRAVRVDPVETLRCD